jgi:hypothetical protein
MAMPTFEEITSEKKLLYADSSLRDNLDDTQAEHLLKWAETQLDRLSHSEGDFKAHAQAVQYLIGRINRFVGRRESFDEEAHQTCLTQVMDASSAIGLTPPSIEQCLQTLPADKADIGANLNALLSALPSVVVAPQVSPPDPKPLVAEATLVVETPVVPETTVTTEPVENPIAETPALKSLNDIDPAATEFDNVSYLQDLIKRLHNLGTNPPPTSDKPSSGNGE